MCAHTETLSKENDERAKVSTSVYLLPTIIALHNLGGAKLTWQRPLQHL